MTTILLVEDNEMNRDMLSRRLVKRGFSVVCANNGHEAVEMADEKAVDLILMDMELPIKDGWTAATEIKRRHSTPIIALTAHALKEDRERALNAGCDDYTTKPIDFTLLISLIESHLQRP